LAFICGSVGIPAESGAVIASLSVLALLGKKREEKSPPPFLVTGSLVEI
jgi:hypothetical protein